jgi:hypothetical protein
VAVGALAAVASMATWWLGATPAPMRFTAGGGLEILPTVLSFSPAATMVMLVGSNLGFAGYAVYAAYKARKQIEQAEQQVGVQLWTLRQLLPKEAAQLGRPTGPEAPEPGTCVGGPLVAR